MSELNDLYQETILEHNKNPRNFREIEGADRMADGNNPLCGDALRVYVSLDGDRVRDVATDENHLGKLKIFAGVLEFPARVKCASLSWHTLDAALHGDAEVSTE